MSILSSIATRPAVILFVVAGFIAAPLHAQTPQHFTATIGSTAFESDDDGVSFIPVMGNFALSASTKGASAWPPPSSRIDRLAIVCRPYEDGQARSFDADAFRNSGCDVTVTLGTKPMGGEPDAVFTLDKSSAANRLDILRANGKVIEGTFAFDLKDASGTSMAVRDGRFLAEDRQY